MTRLMILVYMIGFMLACAATAHAKTPEYCNPKYTDSWSQAQKDKFCGPNVIDLKPAKPGQPYGSWGQTLHDNESVHGKQFYDKVEGAPSTNVIPGDHESSVPETMPLAPDAQSYAPGPGDYDGTDQAQNQPTYPHVNSISIPQGQVLVTPGHVHVEFKHFHLDLNYGGY